MPKQLLSEQNIIDASKRGDKILYYDDDTIITGAARDRAQQLGIRFERKKIEKLSINSEPVKSTEKTVGKETIAIASDHGGFVLKEQMKPFLSNLGYNVIDLGTNNEESCDYPDFAFSVGNIILKGTASRGIMIDSVGIASAIVINKMPGLRAACCVDEFSARSSREHNNANVVTLGGKTIGVELAKSILKIWLETPFAGGRHQKRLDKISDIEKKFLK